MSVTFNYTTKALSFLPRGPRRFDWSLLSFFLREQQDARNSRETAKRRYSDLQGSRALSVSAYHSIRGVLRRFQAARPHNVA